MSTPNLREWLQERDVSDEDTEDDITVELELVWLGKLPLGGAGAEKTRRGIHATT